ncbi:MAG: sugar ABC transporter permease [Actinomycetota bacterium]|nr:sugar ABC transporter permease [Actinomycetota bacterium]
MAAVAEARPVGRWSNLLEERRFLAAVLIGPAVLFILALVGGPLLLAMYLALTDATGGTLTGEFIGLDNFRHVLEDPNFRRAVRNTLLFTILSQAIVLLCAGLIAHALTRPVRGRWFLRLLILLPWAAPVPLSTIGWLWIYDSLFSVVNWVLVHDVMPGSRAVFPYKVVNALPLPFADIEPFNPPQWLGHPELALAAVTSVHAWRIIPFAVVIFLAGLASIPTEVEDAAKVDGATGLKKFWYVTLPLQLPIATVALLFGIVFTATDMTVVYILTQGGPFNSTQMLTTWAYFTGVRGGSLGEGAAVSLFLLPLLVIVAVLMLRFARRVEVS